MSKSFVSSAQVLMLVGTHCQHCQPVLNSLSELVKEGVIDSLEIINVEQKPDIAKQLGVQSVPWLRIGWFELEGVRSKTELQRWVANTASTTGVSEYYAEILGNGRVKQCLDFLQARPKTMASVLQLIARPDEKINVKLGVGVIMEEFASSDAFQPYLSQLADYLKHEDARVRLDACHFLSLTENRGLIESIEPLLKDSDAEVREEAEEAIHTLQGVG